MKGKSQMNYIDGREGRKTAFQKNWTKRKKP